jgi:hypothetical protein
MARLSRLRLRFVTAGFLAEMRKQFSRKHPDKPSPVKNLSDYPPDQRSALMASIEQAILFASPESDKTFAVWAERQPKESSPE